jgi:DNA-binding transcriptional MerR regulator
MIGTSKRPGGVSIGELAKQTGCKVQTIRYYEQIGLMPKPGRTLGHQRIYDEQHVHRLAFIRHSRELGFTLEAIRELLQLSDDPNQPCEQADRIARAQLREVETRMARLAMLKTELERMLVKCKHGRVADCRVIEVLADHGKCGSRHNRT